MEDFFTEFITTQNRLPKDFQAVSHHQATYVTKYHMTHDHTEISAWSIMHFAYGLQKIYILLDVSYTFRRINQRSYEIESSSHDFDIVTQF